MTPDDRARLLDEMPAEVTRRLLETLSPEELKATRKILNYPEQTAGRYMTPEYVALRPDMTAREALESVRTTGRGKGNAQHPVRRGERKTDVGNPPGHAGDGRPGHCGCAISKSRQARQRAGDGNSQGIGRVV